MLLSTSILKSQEKTILSSGQFSGLKVSSEINIYLVQSDSNQVTVSPEDFQVENLKLEIKDGLLKISTKGSTNKAKLYVYSPEFNFIEASGTSNISTSDQISGYQIKIHSSGASDIKADLNYKIVEIKASGASDTKLAGKADTMYIDISGACDIKAFSLQNLYANVKASGACDVQLNTDSSLTANLSGASSIKFEKEPAHKNINSGDMAINTKPKEVWVGMDNEDFSIQENEDTTKIKLNGKEIIVVEKDGETKVFKKDIEPTPKKDIAKFKGNWAGLEFGINGLMNSNYGFELPTEYQFMELNYPKSINFNLNFFQQSVGIFGNKFGLVTGAGLQWNNYKFNDPTTILTVDSGVIGGYSDQTPGRNYVKSKLTSMYAVVPLLLEFQTNGEHETNSFHISAGVIGGVRISSHSKQVYTFDDSAKNKPKTWDDFYIQPFRLDATVRIGWGPINLYGNYSITPMFRTGKGPEVYPFTLGLVVPFS